MSNWYFVPIEVAEARIAQALLKYKALIAKIESMGKIEKSKEGK